MTSLIKNIYYNLEHVWMVMINNSDQKPVRDVFSIVKSQLEKKPDFSFKVGDYPIIVLEGLDGVGKTSIGKRIAEVIGGVYIKTPPEDLNEYRDFFDNCKDEKLRGAFYSIGNYIISERISKIRKVKPVILDRFWSSTAFYTASRNLSTQELENSIDEEYEKKENKGIFSWPEDLIKPNITVLVSVPYEERLKRMRARGGMTDEEESHFCKYNIAFQSLKYLFYEVLKPDIHVINSGTIENSVSYLSDELKHLERICLMFKT